MAASQQHASDSLALDLSKSYAASAQPWEVEQIQHRLNLLKIWFQSDTYAPDEVRNRTVLEIGCGQGDMTVALVNAVGPDRRVIAVDPAPLDYGSPTTLGEAQAYISGSKFGKTIEWVQKDPVEYLEAEQGLKPDFIVLAHSLFYLPSEEYTLTLLRKCRSAAKPGTKLLIAEWGMQTYLPEALAHILAVKVQMSHPLPDANIRTVLEPDRIKELVQKAGWSFEQETWIEKPNLDDGHWEVKAAQGLLEKGPLSDETRILIKQMNGEKRNYGGEVKSMDVWSSVWSA